MTDFHAMALSTLPTDLPTIAAVSLLAGEVPSHDLRAIEACIEPLGLAALLPHRRDRRLALAAHHTRLLDEARRAQHILREQGLCATLLKGGALLALCPAARPLRPTSDIDLLVPDLPGASDALHAHGYAPHPLYQTTFIDGRPTVEHRIQRTHAYTCVSPRGLCIDLHRVPLHLSAFPFHLEPPVPDITSPQGLRVRHPLTLAGELVLHPLLGHPGDREALGRMILDLRLLAPDAFRAHTLAAQARAHAPRAPLHAAAVLAGLALLEAVRDNPHAPLPRLLARTLFGPHPSLLEATAAPLHALGALLRAVDALRREPSLLRYKLRPHRDWFDSPQPEPHTPLFRRSPSAPPRSDP